MTKTETKLAKAEIRNLKASLNKAQKQAARDITAHRKTIRSNELAITAIENNVSRLTKSTADRLAVLEGRLNS